MEYTALVIPKRQGLATFRASISRIDALLSADPLRWCLTAAGRGNAEADFKPAKLAHYIRLIHSGAEFEMPEFYSAGGRVDIMDGRHRLYALHDSGYTLVSVCCVQKDLSLLETKIGA